MRGGHAPPAGPCQPVLVDHDGGQQVVIPEVTSLRVTSLGHDLAFSLECLACMPEQSNVNCTATELPLRRYVPDTATHK